MYVKTLTSFKALKRSNWLIQKHSTLESVWAYPTQVPNTLHISIYRQTHFSTATQHPWLNLFLDTYHRNQSFWIDIPSISFLHEMRESRWSFSCMFLESTKHFPNKQSLFYFLHLKRFISRHWSAPDEFMFSDNHPGFRSQRKGT